MIERWSVLHSSLMILFVYIHLHKRYLMIWFEVDESYTVSPKHFHLPIFFPITFNIVIVFRYFLRFYIEANTALLSRLYISACLVGLTSHLFSIMWWFRPCIHISSESISSAHTDQIGHHDHPDWSKILSKYRC